MSNKFSKFLVSDRYKILIKGMFCIGLFSQLIPFFSDDALACDPCSLYTASKLQGHNSGAVSLSVSEQFTDFKKATNYQENSTRQGELVKGFSTTQVALGYDVTGDAGLQLTIPVIARSYDQIKQFRSSSELDAGIGDLTLLGSYSLWTYRSGDWTIVSGVNGGVKFPTGDTGAIEDVASQESLPSSSTNSQTTKNQQVQGSLPSTLNFKHHTISGVSGGRALTLGSGSYDYVLGTNNLVRFQRFLFLGSLQYTIRTEGDFDYEFADDTVWTTGTGYYFYLGGDSSSHDVTVAGLVTLSGEYKGKDMLKDELVRGSAISNLYLGPQLIFTFKDNLAGEIGVDFRVTDEDVDSDVVPTSRIRAGISYKF